MKLQESSVLLEEVKRTYRNAKYCGREGKGHHRPAGSSAQVHSLWMEAISKAEAQGLDWKKALQEVNNERKGLEEWSET